MATSLGTENFHLDLPKFLGPSEADKKIFISKISPHYTTATMLIRREDENMSLSSPRLDEEGGVATLLVALKQLHVGAAVAAQSASSKDSPSSVVLLRKKVLYRTATTANESQPLLKNLQEEATKPTRHTFVLRSISHEEEPGSALVGWNHHLQQLQRFKAIHGHCFIPSYEPLHHWLQDQLFTTLNPHSSECLQDPVLLQQCTKQLESILGKTLIEWRYFYEDLKYFRALVCFKSTHGHLLVPKTKKYEGLYHWLKIQKELVDAHHPNAIRDPVQRAKRQRTLEKVGIKFRFKNPPRQAARRVSEASLAGSRKEKDQRLVADWPTGHRV